MNNPFFNSPPSSGGGDSSSLAIDDNHFFDDNTARDAYFVTNADELVEGVFISVGAGYQQYNGTSWVDKTAVVTGPTGAAGADGADGADGAAGDNAYVYVAYASADDGTDFTTTFDADLDYIAVKSTSTAIASPAASDFTGLWKNYKGAQGIQGEAGATGSQGIQGPAGVAGVAGEDGSDAFVYIAYASASDGTGFTTTFNAALDYIAVLSTTTEIAEPAVGDFAGLWKMYKGATGPAGDPGSGIVWKGPWNNSDTFDANDAVEHDGSSYVANAENTNKEPGVDASWDLWVEKGETGSQGLQGEQGETGEAGADAYVYIAYASDGMGTGFTTAFDGDLDYIAIKNSLTEITTPEASDFAGLWKMYKGATGATGAAGTDGADGDDAYVYIAYASADDGTGFTMTFNAALEYIAIKPTTVAIGSPQASDFAGLWTKYKGSDGADGTDANISAAASVTFAPAGDIAAINVQAAIEELDAEKLSATKSVWAASIELTIATGSITATQSIHTVDTESDAASDDLATIDGGSDGQVLAVRAAHTDRTVVVKSNTGNILTGGSDISLDDTNKFLLFIYDGSLSKWVVVGGGGASGSYDASSVAITGGSISGTDVTVGAGKTLDVSAGTLKATSQADTTLSGTPKVITLWDSTGTPYYFKAYPTKA